ncbi:MAG: hypothetical protein IKN14_03300 [Clostridiales bacterium]|nr:hypothetical protein [Clostridiales bacterium]
MAEHLTPETRRGKDEKRLIPGLLAFVSNRYVILSVIFCIIGAVILSMTASLQFSGYQRTISASSEGVALQYTVNAPRGDILDCNGIPLATSESVNTLMIANAGLEDEELNAMLLELSYLLDDYNCVQVAKLDDYFGIDPFEFRKDEEEIRLWQTNHNLFNLQDYTTGIIVTFSDNYVKTDPQVFFLYLRKKFNINVNYTEEEAYRICRIRYQIFQDNWSFLNGTPVEIATDVPDELITMLSEQNYKYMGLIAKKTYRRVYTPLAQLSCHVIGYVGNISQESLADLKAYGYSNEDLVGQSGVESQMERYLHGQSGIATYNIWTEKGEEGTYFPSTYGIDAIPGATVNLTIDSDLQRVGIEALKQYIDEAKKEEELNGTGYKTANAGAFVMMNVNTGAVLAMGSYPNFDPNDFVLSMYGDKQAEEQIKYYLGIGEYEEITKEDMPLWNRAIMSQYAPGSTFKPCTALAGLEVGAITTDSNWIRCESPVDIGGWEFKCLEFPTTGHGPLDLNSAMATSCNIYFMHLGVETGIDNIDAMGKRLGLGEYSGIDLPGEICGVRASRETKRLLHENEYDRTWFPADTAQSAIGQFDNCFTILQLCRYTSAIATNKLVTPYVVENVTAYDGSILYEGQRPAAPLGISAGNLEAVRFAMKCVVTGTSMWEGTGTEFADFPISVVCKTGTAETGFEEKLKEYSNGLFICYAPAENPEVAIALVVERGEWGKKTTIIAKKLLAEYFGVPMSTSMAVVETTPPVGDVIIPGNPENAPLDPALNAD